jgi:hypothetical protein
MIKLGADLAGVADDEPLKQPSLEPPGLLDSFNRTISIAIRLPSAVSEQIIDTPPPFYFSVYHSANRSLGEIAFCPANILQRHGFRGTFNYS